jgi:hypothetical protein
VQQRYPDAWLKLAAVDAGANIGSFVAGSSDTGHSDNWGGLFEVTDEVGHAVTYCLSSKAARTMRTLSHRFLKLQRLHCLLVVSWP